MIGRRGIPWLLLLFLALSACGGDGSDGAASSNGAKVAQNRSLSVTLVGSGTVTSSPAGISCGTACSASFKRGSSVTLVATAASGYRFESWSGDCTGSSTCQVAMDANRQVTATFVAAAPPPSGYPDAGTTGVPTGTALTVVNGDLRIATPNTIIDAKDVRGCISVEAPGVTIKRSKVRCTGFYVIYSHLPTSSGAPLTIVDSDIGCEDSTGAATNGTAVGDTNFVAQRVNVHGCENGFDLDTDVSITDSYIHDLLNDDVVAHTDGIQFAIGKRIVIKHNQIIVHGTSAIITNPTGADDVLIENNLLAGGAYTLYCPATSSTNVRVVGNRISRLLYPTGGAYGPWTDCEKVAVLTDNVWDDTGEKLPGQP